MKNIMAKHSLKLLFLRKYRIGKKIYRHLKFKSVATSVLSGSRSGQDFSVASNHHARETLTSGQGTKRHARNRNNSSVDTVDCCLLIRDCIAQNKLRTFIFVVVIGLISTIGLYFYNQSLEQYRVKKVDIFSPLHGIRLKRCSLPKLKPFSSAVRPFLFYHSQASCANEQPHSFVQFPPFSLKNGSLLVRNIDKAQAQGCCYRPFHRNGDNNFWRSASCRDISTNQTTFIPSEVEYMEIFCLNTATHTDFRDAFALISRKDTVEDRVSAIQEMHKKGSRDYLSVVILGLDATSRMNFIRAMPKSNKYLLENLSAISLNGYTKVAENTLPNVVPLLTGRTLDEFKHECVDESLASGKIHLDECPFIWKSFASNGYRTSLAEDDVNIGIFNMNWAHAFARSPTDYYMRPLSILMQKHLNFRNGYCYGPVTSFEKLLENMRSMAEVFQVEPYFQFIWSTKLSHDDFNKLKWGDEPLLKLLKEFNSSSYLNNTALIIIGDHGSRLDKIRSTAQGKIEDRMPVAYVVLPPWFKEKYQKSYNNLKLNSERVSSAFDLHKTLYEFINLKNLERFEKNQETRVNSGILKLLNNETVSLNRFRGSSLFQEFSRNRTCFSAGIPLHWCICHKKIPQDTNSQIARDAADFVVTSINVLLQGYGSCATLTLKSVDEVSKWDPSEIVRDREDCLGEDGDNFHLLSNYSWCNTTDVIVLQIAFTVRPSDATFETTVIQTNDGKWRVTEEAVRTNSYEGQSSCVEQKLKPYCYCTEHESIFDGLF